MIRYSDTRTRITVNWSIVGIAAVIALCRFLYLQPPFGCGVSWRTLSMIDQATQVNTYRCGTEPHYYRSTTLLKPVSSFGDIFVYENGPTEGPTFARRIAAILSNPRNYGKPPCDCGAGTTFVDFRCLSSSGMVEISFSPWDAGAEVITRNLKGEVIEHDDAQILDGVEKFRLFAKLAFPKMTQGDYSMMPIRKRNPHMRGPR